MKTSVSVVKSTNSNSGQQSTNIKVETLADSGDSATIISWDLSKKVNMIIFKKGDATLKDASNKHMDVSGRGEIIVQEEQGLQHKIKVLYLEERCKQVDEKINNFDSFPEESKVVLDMYIKVFDTTLRKSMNVSRCN